MPRRCHQSWYHKASDRASDTVQHDVAHRGCTLDNQDDYQTHIRVTKHRGSGFPDIVLCNPFEHNFLYYI